MGSASFLQSGSLLYFFYLNLTSMGILLPWRNVWPFRSFIAKSALSFFLYLTKAQYFSSSKWTYSTSPNNVKTSWSVALLACLGNDFINSLWSSFCRIPSRCSSISDHFILTGAEAPGIVVFLSLSIASSASVNEENFTRAAPENYLFLLIGTTSRIIP